jgi:hypothetical protein
VGAPLTAVPFNCVEVEASGESAASGVSESHAARLLAITAEDTRAVIRRDDGFTTSTSVSRSSDSQRNSLRVLGDIANGKSAITPDTE